jgi:hypothetical protein
MLRFPILRVLSCLEYGIAVLFTASLVLTLALGLDTLIPSIYDYSSEQDLVDALREGYQTRQITYLESREMLQIYRDAQPEFRLECWRIRLLYAVSICISAAVSVFLFKKYRSLRFRERLRDYFFPPPTLITRCPQLLILL